jgi:hypothetical protein
MRFLRDVHILNQISSVPNWIFISTKAYPQIVDENMIVRGVQYIRRVGDAWEKKSLLSF